MWHILSIILYKWKFIFVIIGFKFEIIRDSDFIGLQNLIKLLILDFVIIYYDIKKNYYEFKSFTSNYT